jgi:hypothetical protein
LRPHSGASYCDVGYEYANSSIPSYDEPLGVKFPGVTYAEPDEPNWVGHLITNYAPGQLLVYNYAKGGGRVHNVKNQIKFMFKQHIGERPAWAPWTPEDTLFSECDAQFIFCVFIAERVKLRGWVSMTLGSAAITAII